MLSDRKGRCASVMVAAVLAGLGMASPARATNLLINPGFESPSSPGNTTSYAVTGWTFYADAERATFDNHTPGGSWSTWIKSFEPLGGVTQTVGSITGGTNYSLSAYLYFEASYPASGATTDLLLTWDTGDPSELDILPTDVTTGVWTQYTLNAMAPAGATSVIVSFDWTNGSTTTGAQSGFVDDADLEGAGVAPTTAVWSLASSGDWNVFGNWSTGSVPNGAGLEADFFGAITANSNVYSDIPVTAGTLNFNNSHTYVIDGAGSLTLQAATGNSQVIVQAGTQEINLPTTLASNTTFNVASGSTLIIGNPLTIDAGKSLTQTGAGTVTYELTITLQTGATFALVNSTHAAALNLQGTAATTIAAHTGSSPTVLQLDSLSLAGSTNDWTSKLDLANNVLIVHNGNLATTSNQVKQGMGGAAGITSSTATADPHHLTTIGVIQNDDGTGNAIYSSFAGVTGLVNTDVLAKYTYFGDANLDGMVDGSDYTLIDNGFNAHLSGWHNGDFNYDGKVDGSDYTLIDNAFNTQGGQISSQIATATAQVAGASSVPEPSILCLAGIATAGLLRRRRLQRC